MVGFTQEKVIGAGDIKQTVCGLRSGCPHALRREVLKSDQKRVFARFVARDTHLAISQRLLLESVVRHADDAKGYVLTDRRSRPRFDIVGRLRGTVVRDEPLKIEDISVGGVSFASPRPLALYSTHDVRLEGNAHVFATRIRVRRCALTPQANTYLIGAELIHLEPSAVDEISLWLSVGTGPA